MRDKNIWFWRIERGSIGYYSTRTYGCDADGFLADVLPSRHTVPSTPGCAARPGKPSARRRPILAQSTITRGRPKCLPFAGAFRNPARTRSAIKHQVPCPVSMANGRTVPQACKKGESTVQRYKYTTAAGRNAARLSLNRQVRYRTRTVHL